MSKSTFKHVKVLGVKTSLPERYIDIDDELQYFGGNQKKLDRQKKMIGYGRRYLADELTTVTDLAIDASEKLLAEMNLKADEVESLIFVNQSPDYVAPADACIAHGRLGLPQGVPCFSLNLGCSGYVYALWNAHALIESGAVGNCLVLAGDLPTHTITQDNRKSAPVFGDAASATFLARCEDEILSGFVLGTDGKGWDKLIMPFGGMRLPYDKDTFKYSAIDALGNVWTPNQSMMKGEEVFAFTMEVAPKLITDTMAVAGWGTEDVSLFAIHQANKQILEMIISKAGIPADKTPTDVFSKYANNSTNSVVTVLCDQVGKPLDKTVLATFGIGLSWAGAALDLSGIHNGGITTYIPPANRPTRQEQIQHWLDYFSGKDV